MKLQPTIAMPQNDSMTTGDEPLPYILRTRYYYRILGYGAAYEWANYREVPFTSLNKPLSSCTVGIVTTAAKFHASKGDQGPTAAYNAEAKFYRVYALPTKPPPDLRVSHIAIDRHHTVASDINAYFPLSALQRACDEGVVGPLSPRCYGLPTNRSKRTTLEVDCQALLALCKEDDLDIALLVPNCPVCHQSVSLAARTLEANGIVTVVLGCAKDIVENVGVARLLFSDFPLGNAAGLPHDVDSQHHTLLMALKLAEDATAPRTTQRSPFKWPGKPDWKDDYSNPDKLTQREIAQKRSEFDAAKRIAEQKRSR